MIKLTARQEEILNLIREAIDNTGFPPTRAEIVTALEAHLCRCGMHNRVIRAVERAAATIRPSA